LGDVANGAQFLNTTTFPIGPRPPPGWCRSYRVVPWLHRSAVAEWWCGGCMVVRLEAEGIPP
jgi:hypothetical protein